jgi:hypothetical protein
MGVTEAQAEPPPRTREERARELIQAAQLQIRDLEDMRAVSTDDAQRLAIDRQIVAVSRLRDAVLADLGGSDADERAYTARLDVDLSRLERAMQSAAATAPQAPSPQIPPVVPPIGRRDGTPGGGHESMPPYR